MSHLRNRKYQAQALTHTPAAERLMLHAIVLLLALGTALTFIAK
jgi:hypothetical protein